MNPVRFVRKPRWRQPTINPPSPIAVERIRRDLLLADRTQSAVLVSLLAYAGLRPGEALGLRWSDVGERALLVERALAGGEYKETKNGLVRSVQIWPALHEDEELWRSRCRSVAAEEPIICDSRGRAWGVYTFGNWRKRIFHPAAARAGVPNARSIRPPPLLLLNADRPGLPIHSGGPAVRAFGAGRNEVLSTSDPGLRGRFRFRHRLRSAKRPPPRNRIEHRSPKRATTWFESAPRSDSGRHVQSADSVACVSHGLRSLDQLSRALSEVWPRLAFSCRTPGEKGEGL